MPTQKKLIGYKLDLSHAIYRAKFHSRRYLPAGKFPVHVDIELAARCNLACVMCPYGTGGFTPEMQGMMPLELALEAIKQAAEGGASSIKFNFRGEPGLSPHLPYCIEAAKGRGIVETAINTNLTAFSKRRLALLCEAGLDLMIVSIDGATKETYERIRVGGDFLRLMWNLAFVHRMTPRPRIRVQMCVQDENRHEVALAKWLFGPLSDELRFNEVADRGGGEGRRSGERKSCPQPKQRLVVAWDGRVFGCCSNWANENPVGQFPEQSLHEIWCGSWRGVEMRWLRKIAAHPETAYPCNVCTVGDSYK